MTSTPDLQSLGDCDDPASVLGFARGRRAAATEADRDVMLAAAKFASMQTSSSLVGPVDDWHERSLPLGGEGCPEVAEFAVLEFAAGLGMSTESGRRYLAKAMEGHYRLTRCWGRLEAGTLPAWRLGMIAEQTMLLSPAAAAFVDQHVAPVAHKLGPAQLMRLVDEAKARFDPEATEAERAAAAELLHFDLGIAEARVTGRVRVDGELDLADALDLEAVVSAGASEQLALGSTDPLGVRRAKAVGELARAQLALGFDAPEGTARPQVPRRQVVLHAHVAAEAVTGFTPTGDAAANLARVEEILQALTTEQVRQWCGNPDAQVTVKPVLDLAEHIWVMSYEVSDRLKTQTQLRDGTCAYPYCPRPAVRCDCEHRVPHGRDPDDPGAAPNGPTCSCNIAPSCRPHHRAKTTGGWVYVTLEPGVYLWRSPLGYQYLRDATGTIDVTPDEDRRRYAREFLAHFDDGPGHQPPDP